MRRKWRREALTLAGVVALTSGVLAEPTWTGLEGTSMRYLLSGSKSEPEALLIVVTGSNSNFEVIARGYEQARQDRAIIIAVPATISSGSQITAERYAHLAPAELSVMGESSLREKLVYDVDGLVRLRKDITRRTGFSGPVFLSGFSKGGNLAWYVALSQGDKYAAVFPVCAIFPRADDRAAVLFREVAQGSDVPIVAFQGMQDRWKDRFDEDWARASALSDAKGAGQAQRLVTFRGHDWHHEEILLWIDGYLEGQKAANAQ